MMGLRLGLSLSSGSGSVAAFSPADLFSGGTTGAWYDPSDLSSMFQDSAGTTPAAVDSPVGKINDKSGNGNHATQATAAARPILRQSGSLYWLEFDAVDDCLATASFAVTNGSGEHSSAAAIRNTLSASNHNILDTDSGSAPTRVSQNLRINANVAETIAFNTTPAAFSDSAVAAYGSSADRVLRQITAGSAVELWSDETTNGSTATSGTMNSNASVLRIGFLGGGGGFFNGRIYGLIHVARGLTADENADVLTYLAAKQGRTL